MAWAPSTTFEDDFIDMQSDFNFIYGQRAYEIKREQESAAAASDPRPKSTYEYLAKREKRNEELERQYGSSVSKSREIRASLAMMERIQQISGTKPLGEHATMADWEDTSTIEREAIAMMRHFGMMSMADETVTALNPPKTEDMPNTNKKVQVLRNGRRKFPLILDPNYFVPRKTRPAASEGTGGSNSTSYSSCDLNQTANSSSSVYYSAKSQLDTSESSQEDEVEVPYQLLVDAVPSCSKLELKKGKPDDGRRFPRNSKKKKSQSN
ncbi:uncharacterized protein Dwil_GK18923 [Drosophila willistoni]|uniref:Uncharacterized protein n=1 Tax=Drosophila willistoni TaxID=7260 RepID=B4NLT5_DROWI|nr:uncharacterized protein LOC6651844 [Drosophila willistoni]XP_046866470.1 uncharacterized protein LOC6651844 [Drosophila willistoni]EDW85324.1 uncharacterized protein Dwil_GK18923 [Drosophila willistoni]